MKFTTDEVDKAATAWSRKYKHDDNDDDWRRAHMLRDMEVAMNALVGQYPGMSLSLLIQPTEGRQEGICCGTCRYYDGDSWESHGACTRGKTKKGAEDLMVCCHHELLGATTEITIMP